MFMKRVGVLLGLYALCALHSPTYTVAGGHSSDPPPAGGEHMEPPPPPPVDLADGIDYILDDGELSETAEEMLEFLLLTPDEREAVGEPDFTEEEILDAEEEIKEIFQDLLEDDISEEANDYLHMMINVMDGAPHGDTP